MYIVGRIHEGRFENYRGVIFNNRAEARDYFEDQFGKRVRDWTVYEMSDMLAHLRENTTSRTAD